MLASTLLTAKHEGFLCVYFNFALFWFFLFYILYSKVSLANKECCLSTTIQAGFIFVRSEMQNL